MVARAQNRVRTVYMVGSPFDDAVVEQAGFRKGRNRHTGAAPSYLLLRTGVQVLEHCLRNPPDLVVADLRLPDMTAYELASALAEHAEPVPVMVVTGRHDISAEPETGAACKNCFGPFVWYGDAEILRTLVCLFEDERNAQRLLPTRKALALLFVEDEPGVFSHYLPVLFSHIMEAARKAIPTRSRPTDPWSVIDSRPLLLLRKNMEGALEILENSATQLVGIITDMRFPVRGVPVEEAGIMLLRRARDIETHIPVVVQAQKAASRALVEETHGLFLWKDSPDLMSDLNEFLRTYCGFGPFVFRTVDGDEWGQANTLAALRALVAGAPLEILENHHAHNNFGAWLGVHGYGEVAARVRQIRKMNQQGRLRLLELFDKAIEHESGNEDGTADLDGD